MNILAQDPSFRALAYSYYDGKDTIHIGHTTCLIGDDMGFVRIFTASDTQASSYKSILNTMIDTERLDVFVSEIPPPVGSFAAGLFALDTAVIRMVMKEFNPKNAFALPPSYLSVVHGGRYTKTDSTTMAKYFMGEVLKDKFEFNLQGTVSSNGKVVKGKMNNDRAESFLFLLRMFCRYNIKNLRNTIIGEMGTFADEKEIEIPSLT